MSIVPIVEVYPKVVALLNDEPAADDMGRVREGLALQLARKLDEAVDEQSTGSAQAVPGISKELRAVLSDIAAARGAKEEFVAQIFDNAEAS